MRKIIITIISVVMSMMSFAAPEVTDVVAKQRYPWNGLVDITCKVSGIDKLITDCRFVLSAVFPDSESVGKMSQFWVMRDGVKSSNLTVHTNGSYHLLWDAKTDIGKARYTNMVVRVTIKGHQMVQLWEDGPYWATTNIGAEEPWEYGYYFWWGDTVGYKRENDKWVASDGSNFDFSFHYANVPTSNDRLYPLNNNRVLASEYDAAQMQWGGAWRMPTLSEFAGLYNKCDKTLTTLNGINGYIVRGRGDYASNSIFIPLAGFGRDTSICLVGYYDYYWSSEPAPPDATEASFNSLAHYYKDAYFVERADRSDGFAIRPVQGPSK